jgi:hypothetical protein
VSQSRISNSPTILRWTLGLVILVEAILFVMPSSAPGFSKSLMPNAVRMVLGWGEIAGSILLLVPRTAVRGAWLLLAVFGLAIVIHLVHGLYNVGSLVIYAAAAWTIAAGTTNSSEGIQL